MTRRARPASPAGAVRGQLAQLGHRPRKRLGQHFLSDPGIADAIVGLANLAPEEPVVEIGPGLGILSDILVTRAARVILIELDTGLAANLAERYRHLPHVRVVQADVLRIDFDEVLGAFSQGVVIGNLPYNVGTPILMRLLEHRRRWRRLVLMLQREVAARIVAPPGNRTYGALSVLTQLYCDIHIGLRVAPGAFVPPPQVESAVVVLDPLSTPRVDVTDAARFASLVRGVFLHRRKQLVNAACGVIETPDATLRAAGIDPTRRPETLSLAEFARLAREVACARAARS